MYRVVSNLISFLTPTFPLPYPFILPFSPSLSILFHFPFFPSSLFSSTFFLLSALPFFPLPFPTPSSLPYPLFYSPFLLHNLIFFPNSLILFPSRGGGGKFIHLCNGTKDFILSFLHRVYKVYLFFCLALS